MTEREREQRKVVAKRARRTERREALLRKQTAALHRISQAGNVRVLVENGHWAVPPSERPFGWETMGVKESRRCEK